ncbi:hypothetical protein AGMMS49982_19380 [Bacteroidia bacterium]|nr:hypothetical protein AGMMS49982_19380 [Bacteroidia bacterium]
MKRTLLLTVLVWIACNTAVAQTPAPAFGGIAQLRNSDDSDADADYITITFFSNDGSDSPDAQRSQTKRVGKKVALDWNVFYGAVGARFIGWAVGHPSLPVVYHDHDTIAVDEDINLYAKWLFPVVSLTNKSSKSITLAISNDVETKLLEVTLTPTNATIPTIRWSSADPSIATVDADGLVTAKKAGKTIVTAVATDETNGRKKVEFEVRVVQRWKLTNTVYADLDEYDILTVTGSGPMLSWASTDSRWEAVKGDVTMVVISEGITTLGDNAFNGLSACTSVAIPSTVTRIGIGTFKDCSHLYELAIPSSVLTIEREAFMGCDNLRSVYNYAQAPQNIAGLNVFDLPTIRHATLNVGVGRKDVYDAAPMWQEFGRATNLDGLITDGYCLVKFEPNNGVFIPSQMPLVGTAVTKPTPDPEFFESAFEGWYVDQDYTTKWDFVRDRAEVSITLYAKWTEYVTVTFDARGGSLEGADEIRLKKGERVTKPSINPSRTNFNFKGWYKNAGCTQEWIFTEDRVTADCVLYAKWQTTASTPVFPLVIPNSRHTTVLQVYPNPTRGELNIVNAKGAEIRVYNTASAVLHAIHASAISNNVFFIFFFILFLL